MKAQYLSSNFDMYHFMSQTLQGISIKTIVLSFFIILHIYNFYGSRSFTAFAALRRLSSSIAA